MTRRTQHESRADRDEPLSSCLERLGLPLQAIEEGRVFLNDARASSGAMVRCGDRLSIAAARSVGDEPSIVARRQGLLAVDKPAAWSAEPDRTGATASVRRWVAERVGVNEAAIHVASRLDVGVSGVMLVCLDRQSRRLLERLRGASATRRRYVGLGVGSLTAAEGVWTWPVEQRGGAAAATTGFHVLTSAAVGDLTLTALELLPRTGRFHQLRRHAARAGVPFFGDRRYGGPRRCTRADGMVISVDRILLHASRVELDLPAASWSVEASIPHDFMTFWQGCGGSATAFSSPC